MTNGRFVPEVIRLLETTNHTQREIAERLGTSFQNVSIIKKRHNVVRPKDRKKEQQKQQIEELLTETETPLHRIAENIGATVYLVKKAKKDAVIAKDIGRGVGEQPVCMKCLRKRHPRLFGEGSDICNECQIPAPKTSELVKRLDRLSRRLKMAGDSIIRKRLENARDFC